MNCDACHNPITGGYWVMPAPSGTRIIWVCRACREAPRYPAPREPTVEETRRLYAEVRRMMKAPNN